MNKENIKLLSNYFSIIPINSDKTPKGGWKKNQEEKYTSEQLDNINSDNWAIITGYDYLEVIDVDLKVFSTAKEQVEFWDEYLQFLKDNILDFEDKFVIYKTKNSGYHILYKSKRIDGNKKIAVLKGHKEAVIESRGRFGYVFLYENNVTEKTYKDVNFITDEDRDILWSISRTYNFEVEQIEKPKKINKDYSDADLKPWEDYNNKTSIFDIIDSDFKIVRNVKDKYIIKRHGAKSSHSGYVFKDSGCMFLFSTGTFYPNEKLIDPFSAFTYKNHNGDFSESAKDLYRLGYGERQKPKEVFEDVKIELKKDSLIFPLEVFPDEIQQYIKVCHKTLNSSLDYMGCSMLWLTSIIIGNSINIEVKKGWKETANVWISLVGKAGIGKTPSISNITFPIMKRNSKEIKSYIKKVEEYEKYMDLDKKEKQLQEEKKKPHKTQFIVNDITLEALVEMHGENKNGIGVLKDELAGWFKDMNKYRQGSDTEHWLSSWSGKEINLNRKTAKSSFVEKAFIPVLGGIQPGIMDSFYTEENKDSGFLDRILFSFPELTVDYYNSEEMKDEYLQFYNDYIIRFYEKIQKAIQYTEDNEVDSIISRFTPEAEEEWVRIFNKITNYQNSDDENEYMKSMLPKQKSYIPRFALIINTLNCFSNENEYLTKISKESVLKAEKLSCYFIEMSKKIKSNSIETKSIKNVINKKDGQDNYSKFKAVYEQDKGISKSKLADIIGVSRTQIYSYIKKLEKE